LGKDFEEIEDFGTVTNGDSGLTSANIVDAMIDDGHRLWLSTYGGGLNVLNLKTRKFSVYIHNPNDPNTISSDKLRKLGKTPDGRILIGSSTKGLNILNVETGNFQHFTHNPND